MGVAISRFPGGQLLPHLPGPQHTPLAIPSSKYFGPVLPRKGQHSSRNFSFCKMFSKITSISYSTAVSAFSTFSSQRASPLPQSHCPRFLLLLTHTPSSLLKKCLPLSALQGFGRSPQLLSFLLPSKWK